MPLSEDEVKRRAAAVRFIALDVDGVLTDGRVYLSDRGDQIKAFDIRDGFGIILARQAGLEFALITGIMSPLVQTRAAALGITEVHENWTAKAEVLTELLRRHSLHPSQCAYMGDDVFDLPPLTLAGLSAAPADAHPEVRAQVHWTSSRPGGRGAVRELVDLILAASGLRDKAWESFLRLGR